MAAGFEGCQPKQHMGCGHPRRLIKSGACVCRTKGNLVMPCRRWWPSCIASCCSCRARFATSTSTASRSSICG